MTYDENDEVVRRQEVTSVTFPGEVMEHIALHFNNYGLHKNSGFYQLTEKFVEYVIPPPYPFAIVESLKLVQLYNPLDCPLTNRDITTLKELWQSIPDLEGYRKCNDLSKPGSFFPFYYSLRYFRTRLVNHSADEVSLIVGYFLQKLSTNRVDLDTWYSDNRYYRDILSFRLCLANEIDHIHSSRFCYASISALAGSIMDQVEGAIKALEIDKESGITCFKGNRTYATVMGHIQTIIRLLSEDADLGQVKNLRQSTTKGNVLIDSVSLRHSSEYRELDEYGLYEVPVKTQQGKRNPDRDDSGRYLQRRDGATRTDARDDLRVFRTVLQAMESRNTIAHSDMHRLPMSTLGKFFDYLYTENTLTFWFAWLLFSLGLEPKRLENLLYLNSKRPAQTCGVYFDSHNNLLTYNINEGATDIESDNDDKPSSSRILQIELPKEFKESLQDANNNRPFIHAIDDIKEYSLLFKKSNTGIRPSAYRISASFWLHVAPYLSELVAANLCGNVPSRYRAQVNYYQFYLDHINKQWQSACLQSQTDMRESLPGNSDLKQPFIKTENNVKFNGAIGSQITVPLNELENLITSINHLADAELRLKDRAHVEQSIEAHVNFINLQHMILFLEQQIVLFLRQVGKRASITIVDGYGTWVRDKDSARFAERRLNLHIKLLAQQQTACLSDFSHFQQRVERYGFQVTYKQEQIQRNLALKVEQKNDPYTFYADVLTTSNFYKQLETLDLMHLFPTHGNVIRHINASELHEVLSQSFLDESMGHEREGMDIFAPYSSTNPRRYFDQFPAIEQRLHSLPFQLLQWEPNNAY